MPASDLDEDEQEQAAIDIVQERALAQMAQEEETDVSDMDGDMGRDLQSQALRVTKEEKTLTKQTKELGKQISTLNRALRLAKNADAIRAIANYLKISIETWWWTIIGAIIDIFIIIPAIYLRYVWGNKTGKVSKPIQNQINDLKNKLSDLQKKLGVYERQKRQIYMQMDMGQAQAQIE